MWNQLDGLTGLLSQKSYLNRTLNLQPEDKMLIVLDLDNFKYINDTYGHNGGDIALKSVGYILREYEKKYDGVVGRYGGDEFVILLTDMDDETELRSMLDELVLRLHSEIGSAGQHIQMQCSIGVSICRPEVDLQQLIAEADEALYFVKQNGKGYYKIHQD